jgi:hypothetical protein
MGRRLIAVKQQEITLLSITAKATGDYTAEHHRKQVEPPWYVAESQQKADNQPKQSTEAFSTPTEQVHIAPIGEDDRKPTAQVHRAFDTDNQDQKKVQESAKHGIKHAPPSSNLNDNAAIKDTRPVKRPKLNFVLKGSHKSKTSANDTGPTLDEAQNELRGVERKGIHPNESKTTSTSVQMEPQDLITQEDFDPDTGNTANKRISL